MLHVLRILVGLIIGLTLFFVGIPTVQALVHQFGYYDAFTYEQAALGLLLVVGCVIAAQLTGLRPPKND